jgi:hypothetical protein
MVSGGLFEGFNEGEVTQMSLIQTPEELANAIRNDPQRVAECLHRINRFGGQAVGCSVLQHSLAVYDRLAGWPASARLWALLHDCHEIITGDVVRQYANGLLVNQQTSIDRQLRDILGFTLSTDDAIAVRRADVWRGGCEFRAASDGKPVYQHESPVSDWVDSVRALLQEVTA